ncbi:MAG: YciI family protein [Isosphaeraceae bacterium]
MRYLCMVCYDQKTLDKLSKPEFDALVAESLAYDDELRKGGHYLYSGALQSVETATILRIQSGKVLATDGPFAETKEHLGGFIVIEARDVNEAIRLSSKIPPARLGSIEIRPIQELEPRRDEPQLHGQ